MIWVSWRQHRGQAAACLALLVALAVYAVIEGTSMRTAFGNDGLAGACLARSQGTGCENGVGTFMNAFGSAINIAFWSVALIVPGLIGVLVGGSLIARELEYGTWRLAWSQTVPRTRWLAVKLALVTGGLIVLGAAMTAVIMWYRAPMDALTGHLQHNAFDYEGLVLTAYILCAFGFAVLAGLLIRRSIPAMVAAFIPWLAIRLVVEFVFRPHFMTPLTARQVCPQLPCSIGISSVPQATGHIGDWVLGMNGNDWIYQPADRFWPFQFIEAGIFAALTAAALGATVWLLHRRAAWTALSSAAVGVAAAMQDHGVVRQGRRGAAARRPCRWPGTPGPRGGLRLFRRRSGPARVAERGEQPVRTAGAPHRASGRSPGRPGAGRAERLDNA